MIPLWITVFVVAIVMIVLMIVSVAYWEERQKNKDLRSECDRWKLAAEQSGIQARQYALKLSRSQGQVISLENKLRGLQQKEEQT